MNEELVYRNVKQYLYNQKSGELFEELPISDGETYDNITVFFSKEDIFKKSIASYLPTKYVFPMLIYVKNRNIRIKYDNGTVQVNGKTINAKANLQGNTVLEATAFLLKSFMEQPKLQEISL